MKKILLLISIIAAFILIQGVYACSCIIPQSTDVEYGRATSVFIGEVKNIVKKNIEIGFEPSYFEVTLNVKEYFKGANGSTIKIKTPLDSAGCGFNFEERKSYIIYAVELEGSIYVYQCSPTKLISDAENDEISMLRKLSKGEDLPNLPLLKSSDYKTGDNYTINEVIHEGDILIVDVSYSGGCKFHNFTLKWDGALSKSLPPHATLVLEHDANGDACEAYKAQRLRFDVSELTKSDTIMNVGGFTVNGEDKSGPTDQTVCTMEAMECSDGSYVGRNSTNNCEFDPCPITPTADEDKSIWEKFVEWFKNLFN